MTPNEALEALQAHLRKTIEAWHKYKENPTPENRSEWWYAEDRANAAFHNWQSTLYKNAWSGKDGNK